VEIEQSDIDAIADALSLLQDKLSPLTGTASEEAEMDDMEMVDEMPAPELDDMEADEMEMDAAEEPEEEVMEEEVVEEDIIATALQEVELELSETEIVNEVAKRVARRILEAKNAKKLLDNALGNK
jgi:hypothetical protein